MIATSLGCWSACRRWVDPTQRVQLRRGTGAGGSPTASRPAQQRRRLACWRRPAVACSKRLMHTLPCPCWEALQSADRLHASPLLRAPRLACPAPQDVARQPDSPQKALLVQRLDSIHQDASAAAAGAGA